MTVSPSRTRQIDPVAAVLLVIIAFHLWLLTSVDLKALVWPDSINTISPALDKLERGALTYWPTSGGVIYPLFVWLALSIVPEPHAIVLAQRAMLAATSASLALAIWLMLRQTRAIMTIPQWLECVIAAAWLMTFVGYLPTIGLAHALMPETLFELLLAGWLLTIVVLTRIDATGTRAFATAAIACLLNVALFIVKPHWLLAAVVFSGALAVEAFRRRARSIAVGSLVGLLIGASVLLWADRAWKRQDTAGFSRVFGPRSLFCNSADLVYSSLERDAGAAPGPLVREQLGHLLTPESRSRAIGAGWGLMGFDGDQCTHGEAARTIAAHFAGRPDEEAAYYLETYGRAAAARPAYVVRRAARQLTSLAAKPFLAAQGGYFVLADPAVIDRAATTRPILRAWRERFPWMFEGAVVRPSAPVMLAMRAFFVTMGVLLVATTILAAAAVALDLKARRPLGPSARAFVVVLLCTLATNVLIALVHLLEPRYVVMQTPLFSFLGLVASLAVIERTRPAASRRAPLARPR